PVPASAGSAHSASLRRRNKGLVQIAFWSPVKRLNRTAPRSAVPRELSSGVPVNVSGSDSRALGVVWAVDFSERFITERIRTPITVAICTQHTSRHRPINIRSELPAHTDGDGNR